jgi:hypothetical protein
VAISSERWRDTTLTWDLRANRMLDYNYITTVDSLDAIDSISTLYVAETCYCSSLG